MTQTSFDTPRTRLIDWTALAPSVRPRYRRRRPFVAELREASSVVALMAILAVFATIPTLLGIAGMTLLQNVFG